MGDEIIVQKRIYALSEYVQLLFGEVGYIDPNDIWIVVDYFGWEESKKMTLAQFIDSIVSVDTNYYLNEGVPYISQQDVLDNFLFEFRMPYSTVNINGVEYWFLQDKMTLVKKYESLVVEDGSITLTKHANFPAYSLLYNNSNAPGAPQYLTLTQLKQLLGISESTVKQSVYTITLPDGDSIASRCAGAIIRGPGTADFLFEASGNNGIDLKITHNLGRQLAGINVSYIDDDGYSVVLKPFFNAYGGFKSNNNIVYINSLATIRRSINISLIISQ